MVTRASSEARGGVKVRDGQAAVELDVRREVARELHDRVAQTLTAMLVDVENFKSEQVGWDDVLKELDQVQSSTRQVLSNLRHLLHDLRGDEHAGREFTDSVQTLLTRFAERTGIATALDVAPGWPAELAPSPSLNMHRIIEEALANVRMHSGARSVRVSLESAADGWLGITIQDDGRGVDTDETRPLGLGMIGMRERALFLAGELSVQSSLGAGTIVKARFPSDHVVPETDSKSKSELMMQGA